MLALAGPLGSAEELPAQGLPGSEPDGSVPVVSVPVIYQDQYLFDDDAPDREPGSLRDFTPEPFGRRYLEIETAYYSADDDLLGTDLEQGLGLRFGRETLNWGTVDLEASIADVDSERLSREAEGGFGTMTLRHSALPVSSAGELYSTLGDQRAPTSSLLMSSYRMRLPTSMLRGFSSEVRSGGNGLRFSTGDTGQSQGIRIPRFVPTGGRLSAVAVDREIGSRFALGAELTDLRDDDDIRDHRSVLLGAVFAPPDSGQEHAARLIGDDDGKLAFWSDSRHRLGSSSALRYGIFRFEPEVVWADLPILNDQQGIYLQADAGNARFSVSGGYDFLRYGLDPGTLSAYDRHSVYFNGSLRLRRSLTIGLNSNLGEQIWSGPGGEQQRISRLNLFAAIGSGIGGLRLDLFLDELASPIEANRRDRDGVAVSLDWDTPERIRLTTELRLERNLDLRGETRRSELSTLLRYGLLDAVDIGLQASLYRTDGALYSDAGGLALSADMSWSFLSRWTGTASLYRNSTRFTHADFLAAPTPADAAGSSSFWLAVRYRQAGGQRFVPVGRRTDGTSGSGTLRGQVFYDENRDGIRQPSEEAAVGVTVLLDGRYETRTDNSGFYTFLPVPTGDHELVVLVEELPLPWGLDDDRPRQARVSYRATATVDFALTQMN